MTLVFPPFFHFKCPIRQNKCKDMKTNVKFHALSFKLQNLFPHIFLRIKNYTLHTSPLKRKFCYAALQPKELPKQKLSHHSSWLTVQIQTLAKCKGKSWFFINLFYGLSRGKWVLSMVPHCMRLISHQRTCHYFTFMSVPQEFSLWWSSSRADIKKSVVARYSKWVQAT